MIGSVVTSLPSDQEFPGSIPGFAEVFFSSRELSTVFTDWVWAGHVARIEEGMSAFKILTGSYI